MAVDFTQTITAEYFGKSTTFNSLKNIANAIKNFFYTEQQAVIEETNLKNDIPVIEQSLIDALGSQGALNTFQNSLASFDNLVSNPNIMIFGDSSSFTSATNGLINSVEDLLGYSIEDLEGNSVGVTSVSAVISNIESGVQGVTSISSIANSISLSLEKIGNYAALAGLLIQASTALASLTSGTKINWNSYIKSSVLAGATNFRTGFMKFVKDIGSSSNFEDLTKNDKRAAVQLTKRDMTSGYNYLGEDLSKANGISNLVNKMLAIVDNDEVFNVIFPESKSSITNLKVLLDGAITQLESLSDEFFDLIKIGWVKDGEAISYSTSQKILNFIEGTDSYTDEINYNDLLKISNWLQKIIDLRNLMDNIKAIIDSYYVFFLANFIEKTNIINYVSISTGVVTRPYDPTKDEDKLYDPDKTANPFTDGGVDKILKKILGKLTRDTSQTITATKTITKLKPKTKKPKVKLKRKNVRLSSKNADPNNLNITTIIRTYEGNIVTFIFDTPSNMNSNSKGTLIYVSKNNMTRKLININRGSYSYLTTNEFGIMKVKTVRNISLNTQFKAITRELKIRDKYSYR